LNKKKIIQSMMALGPWMSAGIRNNAPMSVIESIIPQDNANQGHRMPKMVTGEELLSAVKGNTFIKGGAEKSAEGVKYDFRLSGKILKAKFNVPIDARELDATARLEMRVDPGEVVFVLTEETLDLPMDMIAQLSPKRKMSQAGILTLGGFCIDPGYRGPLILGLLNFSSTPFPIQPGKKLIAATFFKLEGSEIDTSLKPADLLDDFPDELIQVMQRYHPIAPQAVADSVQQLQADLVALRNEIRTHEDWYRRFKEAQDVNNDQIKALTKDLTDEKEVRRSGQDELSKAVQGITQNLSFLRGAAWFVMGTLGVALAVFLVWLGVRMQ